MIKPKFCSTFLMLMLYLLSSCASLTNPTISDSDFISIYAKLTIINELNVNKEHHDKLVEELLLEFNIQVNDIQKSVDFYQQNPRQWLEILEKVKNKIAELRKKESKKTRSEMTKDDSLKLAG